MTAASCIHAKNIINLQVVVGTHNVSEVQEINVRRVSSVRIHPDFNIYKVDNGSDLAFLRLAMPVVLQKRKIELACLDLDFKETEPDQLLMASGYGVVNETTLEFR